MSSGAGAPTRLINTKTHPYVGMVGGAPGKAVFIHGQADPQGLEAGRPVWIPIEFNPVAAYDTADTTISIPSGFTLFSLLEYSSQAASFAIQIYDVKGEAWLGDKLADVRLVAGQPGNTATSGGGGVLIDHYPYTFEEDEPEIFIRVVNQASVSADLMIALHGVIVE
jgi:hypothetical protein